MKKSNATAKPVILNNDDSNESLFYTPQSPQQEPNNSGSREIKPSDLSALCLPGRAFDSRLSLDQLSPLDAARNRSQLLAFMFKALINHCVEFKRALEIMLGHSVAGNASNNSSRSENKGNTIYTQTLGRQQVYRYDARFVKRTVDLLRKTAGIIAALKPIESDRLEWDGVISALTSVVRLVVDVQRADYIVCNDTVKDLAGYFGILLKSLTLCVALVLARQEFTMNHAPAAAITPEPEDQKCQQTIKMITELEQFFTAQTTEPIPSLKGWLMKKSRSESTFGKQWNRRYFLLQTDGLYYSDKESELSTNTLAKKMIDTTTFRQVTAVSELQTKRKHCFEIEMQPASSLILSAASEEECNHWIARLRRVIKFNAKTVALNDGGGASGVMNVDEPSWDGSFANYELRDLLRALDREERYQLESVQLIGLHAMADAMKSRDKSGQNGGEYFIPSMDHNDRKMFERALARQELFKQSAIGSLIELRKLATADPAAFLASISGLSPGEFVIQ